MFEPIVFNSLCKSILKAWPPEDRVLPAKEMQLCTFMDIPGLCLHHKCFRERGYGLSDQVERRIECYFSDRNKKVCPKRWYKLIGTMGDLGL